MSVNTTLRVSLVSHKAIAFFLMFLCVVQVNAKSASEIGRVNQPLRFDFYRQLKSILGGS
jgi:hypothetical protein